MQSIQRQKLQETLNLKPNVQLVEVLPKENFNDFHLPGAINIPVGDGFEKMVQKALPDKNQPIVVYCQDADCPASQKAGQKLDDLGYKEVYDYEAGKQDWKEAGLQVEEVDAVISYRLALINLFVEEGSLLERRGITLGG